VSGPAEPVPARPGAGSAAGAEPPPFGDAKAPAVEGAGPLVSTGGASAAAVDDGCVAAAAAPPDLEPPVVGTSAVGLGEVGVSAVLGVTADAFGALPCTLTAAGP